ncbi:electron transfer flavoprotein subunit alpha/FixB family protein [Thermodesulfobacteriota bacterium]
MKEGLFLSLKTMAKRIFIIAEHFEGKIRPVTYELASFAQMIQQTEPAKLGMIIIGDQIEAMARELAQISGIDVKAIQVSNLPSYNAELYGSILGNLLAPVEVSYVCIAHTTQGMDIAPALAVKLQAACITGIEDVSRSIGQLGFVRGICNGKLSSTVMPSTETAVLTVQPGMFPAPESSSGQAGTVDLQTLTTETEYTLSKGIKASQADTGTIAEAEVVVSAGRGVRKAENLVLIEKLAALFPKSAVGGTRPLCDSGWLEYRQQVGITGATVSPNLYIACGLSGATQHIAGMRTSDFIVAINTEPSAAIFNYADICIVEDLSTFIPVLLEIFEEEKKLM